MRFTDYTYYHSELRVPNIQEDCASDYSLDVLIPRYEPECLRLVIGSAMTTDLYEQVETDANGLWQLKVGVSSDWDALFNGEVYEYDRYGCGELQEYKWDGIRYSLGAWDTLNGVASINNYSFLAYYVYYYWLLFNRTSTTSTGEKVLNDSGVRANVKATMGSIINVDNNIKRVSIYNNFVERATYGDTNGLVGLRQYITDKNKIAEENSLTKPFANFKSNANIVPINIYEA